MSYLPSFLQRFHLALPATAGLAVTLACGGGGGGSTSTPPTPGPVSVTVGPLTANLAVGGSQTFTATVTNTTNQAVTWSLQEGAAGGSLNASGLYTAPAAISGTTATFHVVATSVADSSKSGMATVTVFVPVAVSLTPPSCTLGLGGTQQFTPTVANATNPAVTWSIQESGSSGNISATGLYTAPASISGTSATFHVVATSVQDSTKSATATVAVSALPVVAFFTATPDTVTPGQASTLSWSVGNATSVSINQGVGTVAALGNIQVSPSSSLIYTLSASNGSGQVNQSATVTVATATHALSLLAGDLGGPGNQDGPTSAARFTGPQGVTMDPAGNLYLADSSNNTIRKITPGGMVSTLAGRPGKSGEVDGTGPAALFDGPYGIVWENLSGSLYVCEYHGNRIRRVSPAGVVTTIAGGGAGNPGTDGPGATATFGGMYSLAVDSSGNLYVADGDSHTIRKITPSGMVSTVAGLAGQKGTTDGVGSAARFNLPTGVAVDSASNLYVCDFLNHTLRKIASDGTVITLAGTPGSGGSVDGQGSAARFGNPWAAALDASGNIWVTDNGLNRIRKVTPGGMVSTIAGSSYGSADGQGAAALFRYPTGLALHPSGDMIVSDLNNNTLRRVTASGNVSTFAGTAPQTGTANGVGPAARFSRPEGVVADVAGNVYVADFFNGLIRKITPAGTVTSLAGGGGGNNFADGQGSAAAFNGPIGLAIDGAGNLYVGDYYNHAIRKVTPTGNVTTVAGNGTSGSLDGQGAAATFDNPVGVAMDGAGFLYVADSYNQKIRKISPTGAVTTLAGSGTAGSTDGPGNSAAFSYPQGVAVDSAGFVYVVDRDSQNVRKVGPDGTVTTLAGSAGQAGNSDGTGANARFYKAQALAIDPASGNLYVADMGNSLIRMVTPSGVVTTVAGQPGVNGALLGTLPGVIFSPYGINVAPDGKIFFTTQNAVVTMVR